MSDDHDLDYHATRAAAERQLAQGTADPKIAAVHWELAALHEKLIDSETGIPPEQRIRA